MTIETVAALVAKLTTDLTAAQSAITQDIVNIRHLFTAGADTSAIENALNELDAKVNALPTAVDPSPDSATSPVVAS